MNGVGCLRVTGYQRPGSEVEASPTASGVDRNLEERQQINTYTNANSISICLNAYKSYNIDSDMAILTTANRILCLDTYQYA